MELMSRNLAEEQVALNQLFVRVRRTRGKRIVFMPFCTNGRGQNALRSKNTRNQAFAMDERGAFVLQWADKDG